MKKLILLLAVIGTTFVTSAQSVMLDNQTTCDFYVTFKAFSANCGSTQTGTFFVAANSTAVATPPAGFTFEIATVHSGPFPTPSIPASYYTVIQRPGPISGWPVWCSLSWGADPFAECGYDTAPCSGILTEACWGGGPNSQLITIVI